jgi:dTDP-glucose pyrophosphorylase
MNVLVPLAGAGSRFADAGYTQPKPFIRVIGDTMIREVIGNLRHESYNFIFVINTQHCSVDEFLSHISDLGIKTEIYTTDEKTDGPACTALLAKNSIDNEVPLIIVNCDQIIRDFEPTLFNEFSEIQDVDGVLGCFISSSKKNSYVKLDSNGEIIELREKIVISNIATNGLHYWKKGSMFVRSAEEMIRNNDRYNNEFYIAPTYNYLVNEGKKILPYFFNLHHPIGTPEDLIKYQEIYL